MKRQLAGLLSKARRLESAIESRVEAVSRQLSSAPRQPLETVHAIVGQVAAEAHPAGRGRHVFPYSHVRVWLAAASPRDRARLSTVCDGPPSLADRLRERLAAAGCEAGPLSVKVSFATDPKPGWLDPAFHVEYSKGAPVTAEPPPSPRLVLTVIHGTADRASYAFSRTAVSLGRGSEVRDSHDRLLRTNQVAFVEGGGDVNQSVSRQHARIEYEPAQDRYRLHDDGALQGTSVIREGRGLAVPRGRGLRLRSGDVIALGQARVRVAIQPPGS